MPSRGGLRYWIATTILVAVIIFLAGTAGLLWLRAKSIEMDIPVAIQATGWLVDYCHTYKREHGEWPPPGIVKPRGVTFIKSYDRDGVRVDEFDYGNGQYAQFEFRRDNIAVFSFRPGPTTRGSGGAP